MAEYPDASTVRALYWFTKDDERHGYPITDRVEQEVLGGTGSHRRRYRRRRVPRTSGGSDRRGGGSTAGTAHPTASSDQHVRRDWERKREDPALTGYLSLIEPGAADDLG